MKRNLYEVFSSLVVIAILSVMIYSPVSSDYSFDYSNQMNNQPVQSSDLPLAESKYKPGDEILEKRTENSKTYLKGNGEYTAVISSGSVHYKDDYSNSGESWKDIDLTMVNGKITKAPYELTVDGYSVVMRDKKTGSVTNLTLLSVGTDKTKVLSKPTKVDFGNKIKLGKVDPKIDVEIEATNIAVRFKRIIASADADHSANFEVKQIGTGIKISSEARDTKGNVKVNSSIQNGILTESISIDDKKKISYPIEIDPIATFNTNYSTSGGQNWCIEGLNQTWTQARTISPPGCGYASGPATDFLEIGLTTSSFNPYYAYIYRLATFFDTSSLSGTTVRNATLSLAGWLSNHDLTANPVMGVYSFNGTSNLDMFIFSSFGTTSFGSISYSSFFTASAYNNITLNASGLSNINTTGTTRFSYRLDYEATNTAPAWSSLKTDDFVIRGSASGYPVKLYIDYTTTPTVTTTSASSISYWSATLGGSITDLGDVNITKYGIQYGTTAAYGSWVNSTETKTSTFSFTNSTTGLNNNTLYYYRAWAINPVGIGYGSQSTFTTLATGVPTLTTTAASSITINSAVLGGSITAMGYPNITSYGLQYGTTVAYGSWINSTELKTTTFSFTNSTTGLNSTTLYYYRPFAINTYGIGYGAQTTFTTSTPTVPTVTVQNTSSVTNISATGNGNIGSLGGYSNCSARGFDYGTSSGSYPSSAVDSVGGYLTGAYTKSITGLSPGTLYYYRARATNPTGIGNSTETTFLTIPDPPAGFTATGSGDIQIDLSWTKGTGAGYTLIRYKTTGYPTGISDGTQIYLNTGTSYAHTPVSINYTYYYSAWSQTSSGGYTQYSSPVNMTATPTITAPQVTTSPATGVTYSVSHSANLNGYIVSTGGTSLTCDYRGFVYGTVARANPGNTTPPGAYASNWTELGSFSSGSYSQTISGLVADTPYYYRAYAHNTQGWTYGDEQTFSTLGTPSITIASATNLATTSAQLNAVLSDDGNQPCDVRFGYDNVTHANFEDYTGKTVWVNNTYSSGGLPYHLVSGLTPAVTYFYRAQVKNDFANSTSAELTLATAAGVSAPTNLIATAYSSSIILAWTKGLGSTTTYIRAKTGQYPTSLSDGVQVANITSATTTYSGLLTGTTYYFRAWGWSGGIYSTDNTTAMATTSAGSTTNTTTVASNTTLPSSWYRNTTTTGFADNPVSPIVTSIYDAYEIPETTIWMLLAIILSMAVAIWIYSISSNLVLSAMALAAGIGFSAVMGLLPMWTLFAMIVFALAIIVISTRYGG